MNRSNLAVILLVIIVGTVVISQGVKINKQNQMFGTREASIQIKADRNNTETIEATHRLAYHCKMIVVESLVIANTSISDVFDTAIELLN